MKVLQIHNKYQQPGGEDIAVESLTSLLNGKGHSVVEYSRDNNEINNFTPLVKTSLLWNTTWSRHSYNAIEQLIQDEKPDVAHFHNTFPLISPSAYFACQKMGVPVVQTLHNYRILCPSATFFRNGHVCEDCLGKSVPWPGIIHACYHGSRFQTAVSAAMSATH